ncbi:MAG: hypothetical protein WA960_07215 [Tunicatimonas sp.]
MAYSSIDVTPSNQIERPLGERRPVSLLNANPLIMARKYAIYNQ